MITWDIFLALSKWYPLKDECESTTSDRIELCITDSIYHPWTGEKFTQCCIEVGPQPRSAKTMNSLRCWAGSHRTGLDSVDITIFLCTKEQQPVPISQGLQEPKCGSVFAFYPIKAGIRVQTFRETQLFFLHWKPTAATGKLNFRRR